MVARRHPLAARAVFINRHPLAARAIAARRLEMASSGMACRPVAILSVPSSNLIETSNLMPASSVTTIAPVSTGNIQINREGEFTGYIPESSFTTVDENMVVPTGYDENVKVKNKDWGVKVKDKGFSPDYSLNTTSVMPLNQGMTTTELVSTSGAPLCRLYQNGSTLIKFCPATNACPAANTSMEREATFLGYFPKTCENVTAAPLPEPEPAPVMEQNLEPEPAAVTTSVTTESCHRGCRVRRTSCHHCGW